MRKSVIAVAPVTLLGALTIASADNELKGTIKSIDATAHTITVEFSTDSDSAKFKVGDKVKVKTDD